MPLQNTLKPVQPNERAYVFYSDNGLRIRFKEIKIIHYELIGGEYVPMVEDKKYVYNFQPLTDRLKEFDDAVAFCGTPNEFRKIEKLAIQRLQDGKDSPGCCRAPRKLTA